MGWGGMYSVVESVLSMHEALGMISNTKNKVYS
jgi:hypothetical protein